MFEAPDHRRLTRHRLALRATLRTGLRTPIPGVICDLSVNGCSLSSPCPLEPEGTRVYVRPEGLGAIAGHVRWAIPGRIGIEFESPLYEPVVDHLLRLHGGPA